MTKSKSSMVTKVFTHLLTDTSPVLESPFSLLPLGRYLLPVTTQKRYQSTGSSRKFFFTTTSRNVTNVTIVRCRMSLVTILVMDFVMIHWIHWIQRNSFRKNSIVLYFRLNSRITFYFNFYKHDNSADISDNWTTNMKHVPDDYLIIYVCILICFCEKHLISNETCVFRNVARK